MSRTKRRLPKDRAYHRKPKTLNEHKAVAAALVDGVAVRPKRGNRQLPDSRDDLHCGSWKQCCRSVRTNKGIKYFEVNVKGPCKTP